MSAEGLLFIVCGPSGVGKTTICDELLDARPDLTLSISYTTRQRRGEEEDGVHYHFVDRARFDEMRDSGAFAEWAEVHGNCYGTSIDVIRDAWAAGKDVLFDIDYQGARQLKETFPHAVATLIIPPGMEELERRLRERGTDAEDVIQRRLNAARTELAQFELFDYIVENDELETAIRTMLSVYDASRRRTHLHAEKIRDML